MTILISLTIVQRPPIPHTNVTNHCTHAAAAQCMSVTVETSDRVLHGGGGGYQEHSKPLVSKLATFILHCQ